jgi:hypothetical protein
MQNDYIFQVSTKQMDEIISNRMKHIEPVKGQEYAAGEVIAFHEVTGDETEPTGRVIHAKVIEVEKEANTKKGKGGEMISFGEWF